MEESLPNITGKFGRVGEFDSAPLEGAFTGKRAGAYGFFGNGGGVGDIVFDASRVSSIYQDNAPVRPLSMAAAFLIRY